MSIKLIVFDFYGTLVLPDESLFLNLKLEELLYSVRSKGYILVVASDVEKELIFESLEKLGVCHLFDKILNLADLDRYIEDNNIKNNEILRVKNG